MSWTKIFARETKFIVTPLDKTFNTDNSPKPIMFLPSNAEINLHRAGTYLCLLEKFFPDVIKIYWKEKDGNTILEARQGDTMKTKDTYMKFSWLTVTGDSMDKEHRCIVKHEKNKGGGDQEILFPPVNEAVNFINPREAELKDQNVVTTISPREASLTDENVVNTTESGTSSRDDLLDLQFSSTSAYYIYLLLLIKSALHGALVTYCLCRRSAVFCDGKST